MLQQYRILSEFLTKIATLLLITRTIGWLLENPIFIILLCIIAVILRLYSNDIKRSIADAVINLILPLLMPIKKLFTHNDDVKSRTMGRCILYEFNNIQLYLPYSRSNMHKKYYKVIGDEKIEIKHPQGVGFVCNASQLSCEYIEVVDGDDIQKIL